MLQKGDLTIGLRCVAILVASPVNARMVQDRTEDAGW